MGIKWLNVREKEGSASFYKTNITLNTVASVSFEYAYRVQIGLDDDNNVIIKPINKDKVLSGIFDEYGLLKIAVKKTYSRISSTEIMAQLGEALNLNYDNQPLKFKTYWNENDNELIIYTGGKR